MLALLLALLGCGLVILGTFGMRTRRSTLAAAATPTPTQTPIAVTLSSSSQPSISGVRNTGFRNWLEIPLLLAWLLAILGSGGLIILGTFGLRGNRSRR